MPFPSPGDLPDPGIERGSPALQADDLPSEPPGKPWWVLFWVLLCIWHNKFNKTMFIAHALKHNLFLKNKGKGFPGGSVVKNPPAVAGDTG